MSKAGRPTKLTQPVSTRIREAIRNGMSREKAARLAGVAPSTIYAWLAEGEKEARGRHRDFRDAVEQAEDELYAQAARAIVNLLASQDEKVRLQAAKFLLERRFPEDWSARKELRISGKDGGPVQAELSGPSGGPLPVVVEIKPLFRDEQLEAMSDEQLVATIETVMAAADAGVPLKTSELFSRHQLAGMSVARLEALGRALSKATSATEATA